MREASHLASPSCLPLRLDSAHDWSLGRKAVLASEARRLSRRRAVALAVAARCRQAREQPAAPIAPEAAEVIASRALRRATTLHVQYHRTLDSLVSAGGFDEALAIVRERRS